MTIKRIIFDLDNTLIPWKNEYSKGFKRVIEEYNLKIDYKREAEVTDTYESFYDSYKKEYLLEHFNKVFEQNVKIDFINKWLEYVGEMSEEIPEVTEVLEYLSKKYELVVLTNWFKESQEKRLEIAGMRKYFLKVVGGDEYKKPDPNSYKLAIDNLKPEECIMIGDNLELDIKGAVKAGLNAIYLNPKEEKCEFKSIKSLSELKDIL